MKAAKILSTKRHSSIAFALATAVALALGSSAAGQIKPPSKGQQVMQMNAEKNKQFQDLKERAQDVARRMSVPRRTEDTELLPQWDSVLAGLEQVGTQVQRDSAGESVDTESYGGASEHPIRRNLPLLPQGPPWGIAGYLCMKDFARSNEAQWLYKCYPEPKS